MPTSKTVDLRIMARHYVIAALWADCPEGTHPRATRQAFDHALKPCGQFVQHAVRIGAWDKMLARPDYWAHPDFMGRIEGAVGHDLYLTSAGHGVGFWDRDALRTDGLGDALTNYVQTWMKPPEVEFYKGWMYIR